MPERNAPQDPLVRELQDLLGADQVLWKPVELLVYECDGLTLFKQVPRCVLLPSSTEQVQAALRLLHERGVPFVPRGAGTGLSGGAIAGEDCVLIELARMNRVLEIDAVDRIARVEAGVVNSDITKAAARHELFYAPDPSSQSACTIGGNAAENASGPHSFKYGCTAMHVLSMKVVLSDGELVELGSEPPDPRAYDLRGLYLGSEGTLGIATEFTLRLTPVPETIETILAAFKDLETACRAVAAIVAQGVRASAIETLDDRTIETVENSVNRAGYPKDAGAVLLVELDGPRDEVDFDIGRIERIASEQGCILFERARDAEHRAKLWKGRKGALGALGRVAPDVYVQDAVVPRSRQPEVVRAIGAICDRHGLKLANVAHAGEGSLHPNISYDGTNPDEVERVHRAGREIFELCLQAGGTLTGEHGIGLEKRDYMPMLFGEDDLEAFRRVRECFDPAGLANPGKLLPVRSCGETRAALREARS